MRKGSTHTEETRLKMKLSQAGHPPTRLGAKHSEESRQRMSEAHKGAFPSKLKRYGLTKEDYANATANGLEWCKDCHKFREKEQFSGEKSKWTRRCKDCTHVANMRYRDSRDPDRLAEMSANTKKWRDENTDYERRHHLFSKYGVDVDWYRKTLGEQDGHCALCDALYAHPNSEKILFVDHHHASGKVRGILCAKCNTHLGILEADLEWPTRALAYLRKHGSLE